MGSMLNSIFPAAGGTGRGGRDQSHGPSYYAMHPNESPPQNPHPSGATMMQNAGQEIQRGGNPNSNPFLGMLGGFGQSMMGQPQQGGDQYQQYGQKLGGMAQQGGQGFGQGLFQGTPLAGLFGGGQQGQQQNPFAFLGGL